MFLKMEYSVYDYFQKMVVIDDRDDGYFYKKYRGHLDDLYLINLDPPLIDRSTGKVNRRELAILLDTLAGQEQLETIFVDFLFLPADTIDPDKTSADSLLIQAMKRLGDRLVLPYLLSYDALPLSGRLAKEDIKRNEYLLHYRPSNTGYLDFQSLQGFLEYRYCRLKLDNDSLNSVIFKILERHHDAHTLRTLPTSFEINYLLRDKTGRAISWISGNQIREVGNRTSYFQGKTRKVALVGLFNTMKDHYDRPVDQHATPIKVDMNGIYIIINAYLNAKTKTYFKRAGWWVVLFFNFLIGIFGLVYYYRMKKVRVRKLRRVVLEIVVSGLFFIALLFIMFITFQIKYPFVITTLAYVRNQPILKHCLHKFRV